MGSPPLPAADDGTIPPPLPPPASLASTHGRPTTRARRARDRDVATAQPGVASARGLHDTSAAPSGAVNSRPFTVDMYAVSKECIAVCQILADPDTSQNTPQMTNNIPQMLRL